MTSLVVDLRRAFDSGLGTYIREVVPRSLQALSAALPAPLQATGLIASGSEARHRAYLGEVALQLHTCSARPLSVAEQWALRRALPANALFWATTLAHPLYTRRRFVATVHDVLQIALPAPAGPGPRVRHISRLYFESLRRCAAALLFNSAFSLAEFRARVGQPRGTCVLTPLGVDARRWQAQALSIAAAAAARPYFLALGNIRPHKNLALLVRAFARVAHDLPHDLVLVGRPAGPVDLGIPPAIGERVRLLGEVAEEALPQWLGQAAALVLPSLYEGFGLPALEAMASGCLVLASSAAALPETCGGAAIHFDPHDADALGQALLRVARMAPQEQANWRVAGLRRAQDASVQRTAALTADALHAALLGQAPVSRHPAA